MTALSIVSLNTPRSKTLEQVVETLEELLARAKAGEFEGLAWAASLPNGACNTGFTTSVDFHALLSGVTILQHRLIATRADEPA